MTTTAWPVLDIAAGTLKGDLRDILLSILREAQEQSRIPWHLRPEDAQKRVAADIEYKLEPAITKAVKLIAAANRPYVFGHMKKIDITDDKMKITCEMFDGDHENVQVRLMRKHQLLLLSADSKGFMGEKEPFQPNPPQGELWEQERRSQMNAGPTAEQIAEAEANEQAAREREGAAE